VVERTHSRLKGGCRQDTSPHRGILHLLWGGQSCPQPPFRRPFRAVRESSDPQSPAETRLQPGLTAPPRHPRFHANCPFTTVATGPPRNVRPWYGEFRLRENDWFTS